jgi:hypothetical protein
LRGNTLRACRPLLLAEPIRANDGVLKLLGALKAAQFPAVGATQATVIGLLLELLQTCLVTLRVRHRVLRRLLGALEAAQFPAVGATKATVIGLLLKLLQTCLVALWVLRRALRCLLGALELAELTPLDATQTTTLRLQLLQATLRLAGDRFVRTGR